MSCNVGMENLDKKGWEHGVLFLSFGDSLAFPRHREGQSFSDMYHVAVGDRLGLYCIFKNEGGATSRAVKQQMKSLKSYSPRSEGIAFVILHFGIVDCTPRPTPYWLYQRRRKKWALILSFISKSLLPEKPWVNECEFFENTNDCIRMAKLFSERVILVGICPAGRRFREASKGVDDRIRAYDALLEKSAHKHSIDYIDMKDVDTKNHLINDGHHLSPLGHEILAAKVIDLFRKL